MFNTCYRCGLYRADKRIDPEGRRALCPECGFAHPFVQQPLYLVGGASGAGKSALCRRLVGELDDVVMLDSDILWQPEFNTPDDNYRAFFETWLRMAKNIGQSGRSVVIFGAGFAVPENVEPCVERRYLGDVHYLALVCDDDVLAARLRQRPAERGNDDAYIVDHLVFNRWLKAYVGEPPLARVDTTSMDEKTAAEMVAQWIVGLR
jgi:predicted kinase